MHLTYHIIDDRGVGCSDVLVTRHEDGFEVVGGDEHVALLEASEADL